MTSAAPSTILKAALHTGDGLDVRLLHYPAGLTQPRHCHEQTQLSVLLVGGLREITARDDVEAVRPASGLKPAGQSHAAAFGPQGALMLSMTLTEGRAPRWAAGEWRPNAPGVPAVIAGLLTANDPTARAEMAEDLTALLAASSEAGPGLAERDAAHRLKRALDEDPDDGRIGRMAEALGLHRAHLTRCFTETYGLAPSLYRARAMTARALSLALHGEDSLAAVAADAGFADQSHLARTCRRQIGVSLSRIRALFAGATSVQAAAA